MKLTYFAPREPLPSAALDLTAYAAEHCKQTTPTEVLDLDMVQLFDYMVDSARVGRKGDAGYVIAGECTTTRKDGGPAPFVLIDYDDRPEGPDWELLNAYQGFAWTTAKGHPHWRVLVPLTEPMAHGKLECPFPGGHIRNRTQPAFLPTHERDVNAIQWRVLEGEKTLDGAALGKVAETFTQASGSLVGAVFKAAGYVLGEQSGGLQVRCPWQKEHTGGKGGGTVVFHDDPDHSGLGKFHCGHGHCAGRGSAEAIEALRGLPAVADELAMWPTPASVLEPYKRLDAPPAPRVEAPRFLSGKDLLIVDDEVQWLCHPLQLCPGRPPMIFGDSSAGKTSTAISMALSIAAGLPIFGEFACRRGPVLHVSLDSGLRSVKKRYREFANGMGLDLSKLDIAVFPHRLQLVDKYGKFERSGFEEIDKEAQRGGYKLVILDSLAALTVGMDENATDIGGPIRATTDNERVWLWLHHTGKSGETIRGSSAIKAACGGVWKGEKVAEELVSWQMEKPCEEFCGEKLPKQFRTRWHHAPGEQRLTVEPEEERAGNSPMRIQEEVMRQLRMKGPLSSKQLEATITGKATTIRDCVKELAQRNVLTYDGKKYHIVSDILAAGGDPG